MPKEEERLGGEKIDDTEARALLSIMFAERMGDAARALKAYGDLRTVGADAQIKALLSERDGYLAEVRRLSDIIASWRAPQVLGKEGEPAQPAGKGEK